MSKTPKIRTQWDAERVTKKFELPSMTKQSHATECDINLIMQRHLEDGYPIRPPTNPIYGEYNVDYHQAVEASMRAQKLFDELPNRVRKEFGSVANFLSALHDPAQEAKLMEMGILDTPPEKNEPPLNTGAPTEAEKNEPAN